jgi:hypothetical protein
MEWSEKELYSLTLTLEQGKHARSDRIPTSRSGVRDRSGIRRSPGQPSGIKPIAIMFNALPIFALLATASYVVATPLEFRGDLVKREHIDYEWREGDARPNHCVLHALGGDADDSDNLATAVDMCGTNGVIELRDDV